MTVTDTARASLRPGTAVGRYTIERLIGAGGMGEVYSARDTTLGRVVALKILTPRHAGDVERVRRFVREAEAASSLNHPAIVSVHDSGVATVDGEALHFLTMELVDGEPLSSWLRSSRQLRRKLEVLSQVADGLARAHRGGIVHRDLKPDNIIVARDGYAKIVDFGIAKLTETSARGEKTTADTVGAGLVGTVAYMSPEQVEGRALDHRSDIFSFGCVLHEVVTGTPPFRRGSTVDTLHAIVHETPHPPEAGPDLQRIVRRCLAKDPEERYQSIKDAALDLRDLTREIDVAPQERQRSRPPLVAILAIVALLAAAAVAYVLSRRGSGGAELAAPAGLQMTRLTASGNLQAAVVSPDGKYLVYATQEDRDQTLWVRQIAAGTDVQIIPRRLVSYLDIDVSSDGNYIYYTAVTREDTNVYSLFQLPILGGTPRKIAHDTEGNFALSPDGKTGAFRRINVMRSDSRLYIIDIESGREQEMLQRKFPATIGPLCWAHQGRKLMFVDVAAKPVKSTIWELDVDSNTTRRVLPNEWWRVQSMAAASDGTGIVASLYEPVQAPQVWYLPFDGVPQKLTSDLSAYGMVSLTGDSSAVVTIRGQGASNIAVVDFDRPDIVREVTSGPGNHYGSEGVRWFPDRSLVFTAVENGPPKLVAMNLDGSDRRTITHGTPAWRPSVSRDGKRVLFMSSTGGPPQIWITDSNGSNRRQLTDGDAMSMADFLPNGNEIVYTTAGANMGTWRRPLVGNGDPTRITKGPANMMAISPDGKSMLCRLRQPDGSTPLWRTALISLDGAEEIRYFNVPEFATPRFNWMPDGSAFAYLETSGGASNIWLQPIDGSAPRALTKLRSGVINSFDIAPDGKSAVIALTDASQDAVMIRGFR